VAGAENETSARARARAVVRRENIGAMKSPSLNAPSLYSQVRKPALNRDP
jgi:hypothetical protein